MPRVSRRSLCATGRPCSGPKVSLRVCFSSAFAAASAAISATRVTMAFTFGFTRSICFRCAASASRAESFFARIRVAISTVLVKQTEESLPSACMVPFSNRAAAVPSKISRRVGWFSLTGGSLSRVGLSSVSFSLRGLVHARTKIRRLKPTLLELLQLSARKDEQRRRQQQEHHYAEPIVYCEAADPFCSDIKFVRRNPAADFHEFDDDGQKTHNAAGSDQAAGIKRAGTDFAFGFGSFGFVTLDEPAHGAARENSSGCRNRKVRAYREGKRAHAQQFD